MTPPANTGGAGGVVWSRRGEGTRSEGSCGIGLGMGCGDERSMNAVRLRLIIAHPPAKEKAHRLPKSCGAREVHLMRCKCLLVMQSGGILDATALHQITHFLHAMPITLADIAKRADVSLSTVSRVLNNKEHVSIGTRTAVLEAVTFLGYSRQDARREENLETVLLIVHEGSAESTGDGTMSQDAERLVVAGVYSVLRAEGYATQLAHKQFGKTRGFELPRVSNLVGAINIGSISNPHLLRKLQSDGVPIIIAGSPVPNVTADSVTLDFKSAMLQIVDHLVQRGHRVIGLVNGPEAAASSVSRLHGYRLALALHNLPFAPEQLMTASFTFSSGDEMTEAILEACPTLDALIFGDDDMAVGGLRALRRMGRQVPNDIAVVGTFNYEISNFTDPPLTTVDLDKHELGRAAAQRLIMRMHGNSGPPWTITLPATLIVRASA